MFTFFIQIVDLIYLHKVGLFLVFFILSWLFLISKWVFSRGYVNERKSKRFFSQGGLSGFIDNQSEWYISVIVPVVDEPLDIWKQSLNSIKNALDGRFENNTVIVVPNGGNGFKNAEVARNMGMKVVSVIEASKRVAIKTGLLSLPQEYKGPRAITIILDSDTIVTSSSIGHIIHRFNEDPTIGGVTPKHEIFDRERTVFRVFSDWLEDIRFNEILPGQSKGGAVSCLPGRMLAIKTDLLREAINPLVEQTFMNNKCISGDDRFLTSFLLERNFKCVYEPTSLVYTDAPDTLGKLIKQRLRWSRTSLRETIRSLPWIFRYPYTAFSVLGSIFMRWIYFLVIVNFILFLFGLTVRTHYLDIGVGTLIIGTLVGFIISGFIRQIGHLYRYPSDIKYLIQFLFFTTFILLPTEWYGNISIKESGWMTRDLDGTK